MSDDGGDAPEGTSEPVPAWAYEPVVLSAYDPEWERTARREARAVARALGRWIAAEGVAHVGSTAVPGLAAKPTVDLMAAVTGDLDTVAAAAGPGLAAAGWVCVPPELDARPWRRFLVLPDEAGRRRIAHLHLLPAGSGRWDDQLAFRDALRADPELANAYEALKRRAAEDADPRDREAYTEAKAEFVLEVVTRLRH